MYRNCMFVPQQEVSEGKSVREALLSDGDGVTEGEVLDLMLHHP